MNVGIRMGSDVSDDQLLALAGWLKRDADVARVARISQVSSAADGSMGAVDVINIALTHIEAIGSVLIAYAAWRDARPRRPSVTLTVGDVAVVVSDASPERIAHVVKVLADGGRD
jgi:hypothetical protein